MKAVGKKQNVMDKKQNVKRLVKYLYKDILADLDLVRNGEMTEDAFFAKYKNGVGLYEVNGRIGLVIEKSFVRDA